MGPRGHAIFERALVPLGYQEDGRCGPDAVTLRGRGDLLGVAFLALWDPSDDTGEGAMISVGAHECSGDTNAYFREC